MTNLLHSNNHNTMFDLYNSDVIFFKVCYDMKVNKQEWAEEWHRLSQTPLAIKDRVVVSYDNEKSLLLKVLSYFLSTFY